MISQKFLILLSLFIITFTQDYKEEQQIMLQKIREIVSSAPSYYNENQYKEYAKGVKSNTEIILDVVSYANRHQIQSRYRFPDAVMKSLYAAFMSNTGSTYEKIDYKKPQFTGSNAEYNRIIGFAKKIGDQVTFSVAQAITNAIMVQKLQPYQLEKCTKKFLGGRKCKYVTDFRNRGYNAKEIDHLEKALDTHNQINIREKLNTIKNNDEIVISDKKKLYYGMVALGIKENGLVTVYETSSKYGPPPPKEMVSFGITGPVNRAPYTFRVKSDGNIVVHDKNEHVIWQTHTSGRGKPPFNIVLTRDYNVIVIDKNYKPVWDRAYKFGYKHALIPDDYRILSTDKKYYVSFQKKVFGIFNSRDNSLVRSIWNSKGEGPFFAYIEKDGSFYIVDQDEKKLFSYENKRNGVPPFSFRLDSTAHFTINDSKGSIMYGF